MDATLTYLQYIQDLGPRIEQLARIERNRKRRLNELLPSLEAPTADDLKRLAIMTKNERKLLGMIQPMVDQCSAYAYNARAYSKEKVVTESRRFFWLIRAHFMERKKRLDMQSLSRQDHVTAHTIALLLSKEDAEIAAIFKMAQDLSKDSAATIERVLADVATRASVASVRRQAAHFLSQVRAHPFRVLTSVSIAASLIALFHALGSDPQFVTLMQTPVRGELVFFSVAAIITPFFGVEEHVAS